MKALSTQPKQVTILGLGLFGGGAGATRYYAQRGAHIIVTDLRSRVELSESIAALEDVDIDYRLGRHLPEDFAGSEIVVVNPAIPPNAPVMDMARASGARLETATNILLQNCPAPIAAVTGTHGKSTTVALLGEIMRASGRTTWVGGNLGGSLLPEMEKIQADDAVVIEVSSFQAQRLAWIRRSPHVAAVLNITPNHLDRHPDMDDYAGAKAEMIRYQGPDDFTLLDDADAILQSWNAIGKGRVLRTCAEAASARGIRVNGTMVRVWVEDSAIEFSVAGLKIPGVHNITNAAFAGAMAWLMGADHDAIEGGVASFRGLPERLEFVRERAGVRYYNDSIATTPESAIAALDAFDTKVVMIAGGSSKNHSYEALAERAAGACRAVILLGAMADEIENAIKNTSPLAGSLVRRAGSLEEAVRLAEALAKPGDVVLLSPACASFDMFRNYRERGRRFVDCVMGL
jgi:UDP-N-acetylmuramoylalanine--D-glutamate ligase